MSCFCYLITLLIICYYQHTQKICEAGTTSHNKKSISGKKNSYEDFHEKKCIHPYNHILVVVKNSFFLPKIWDILILNWGRRLMQTEQLIDCGLCMNPEFSRDKFCAKESPSFT